MTLNKELFDKIVSDGRTSSIANFDDPALGPLRLLPGMWKNTEILKGYGFNMMALPLLPESDEGPNPEKNGFRILMNQYSENLNFAVVDKGVPNRGSVLSPETGSPDQTIVALDYFQNIEQIDSDDFRKTDLHERFNGKKIHKEPGLWLHMIGHETTGINIARLGTIPHGNSFLASGRYSENRPNSPDLVVNPSDDDVQRMIPSINGVVVGGGEDPQEVDLQPIRNADGKIVIDYFAPYRHYHENPYKGSVSIQGFDGFDPVHTTDLLRHAYENVIKEVGTVKRIQRLTVDSTLDHSGNNRFTHNGIVNIPFVVREADATAMKSTFILYEVEDAEAGKNRYFLQYAQNVILDFIGRPDGHPGRARWPHVSINTMERVSDSTAESMMEAIV